jgi:hypothetical protein
MKRAFAVLLLSLSSAAAVFAQMPDTIEQQVREEKTRALSTAKVGTLADCPATPITMPFTLNGALTATSCRDFLDSPQDVYAITVQAGETIDITYQSTQFEVFLFMYLGGAASIDTTRVSFLPGLSKVTAHHTFKTAGTYRLEASALHSFNDSRASTGFYSLAVTTDRQTSGCTTTPTTACLQGGRFRVSIAYVNQFASPPAPGTFLGAKLLGGAQNPDVATYGISSPQAIEVVVRIQDARPFGLNRFDVYYGGLTDLEYVVTVTDLAKSVTKTYRNPPGTVGGGVDRTSFVAD